jgi:hypothetical protein
MRGKQSQSPRPEAQNATSLSTQLMGESMADDIHLNDPHGAPPEDYDD